MNVTREELDFYTEFCVNKDMLKYKKLSNKKLAKYEGSTKHLKLPMPKRVELLYLDEQFNALMGREFMKEVDSLLEVNYLNNTAISTIAGSTDPRHTIPLKMLGNVGGANTGPIDIHLCSYRHNTCGGRIFTIRDTLLDQLLHTDIGQKTPLEYLRLPYNNLYLEFGETREDRGLYIHDRETGNHILEGVYLIESDNNHIIMRNMAGHQKLSVFEWLGISINTPVRVMELCFTGSPINKSGRLNDDTYINYYIYIPEDGSMDLTTLIEKHISYYMRDNQGKRFSLLNKVVVPPSTENGDMFSDLINAVVVLLLYLNSKEPIIEDSKEYSDALTSIRKLGPSKYKRMLEKVSVRVDRSYVGSKHSSSGGQGSKSTHWRRGHYRLQKHGKDNSETKLIWLKPTIIGLNKDSEEASTKPYDVK